MELSCPLLSCVQSLRLIVKFLFENKGRLPEVVMCIVRLKLLRSYGRLRLSCVLFVDNPLTDVQKYIITEANVQGHCAVVRFVPSFYLFQFMSLFEHLHKYSVPRLISSVVIQ